MKQCLFSFLTLFSLILFRAFPASALPMLNVDPEDLVNRPLDRVTLPPDFYIGITDEDEEVPVLVLPHLDPDDLRPRSPLDPRWDYPLRPRVDTDPPLPTPTDEPAVPSEEPVEIPVTDPVTDDGDSDVPADLPVLPGGINNADGAPIPVGGSGAVTASGCTLASASGSGIWNLALFALPLLVGRRRK